MYLSDCYEQRHPVISFEIFPPKKESGISSVLRAVDKLRGCGADFISVTYSAGGTGANSKTAEITSYIKDSGGTEGLAHLTCATAGRDEISGAITDFRVKGIKNVLALRGDIPEGYAPANRPAYPYAKDLVRELKLAGGFCVGAAAYPEGHIECESVDESVEHMRAKADAGADFFITQLCFENRFVFEFLNRIRRAGISAPVSIGVMPILSREQIQKMIFMCGVSLPSGIIRLLHRYADSPEDLRKAGMEHAAGQFRDLYEAGVDGIHIYTMNRPEIAGACLEAIGRRFS